MMKCPCQECGITKTKFIKNKINFKKHFICNNIYMYGSFFLTIVTKENGKPVHFEELIPKVNFIKLISSSIHNSWYNLNREGSIGVSDEKK